MLPDLHGAICPSMHWMIIRQSYPTELACTPFIGRGGGEFEVACPVAQSCAQILLDHSVVGALSASLHADLGSRMMSPKAVQCLKRRHLSRLCRNGRHLVSSLEHVQILKVFCALHVALSHARVRADFRRKRNELWSNFKELPRCFKTSLVNEKAPAICQVPSVFAKGEKLLSSEFVWSLRRLHTSQLTTQKPGATQIPPTDVRRFLFFFTSFAYGPVCDARSAQLLKTPLLGVYSHFLLPPFRPDQSSGLVLLFLGLRQA